MRNLKVATNRQKHREKPTDKTLVKPIRKKLNLATMNVIAGKFRILFTLGDKSGPVTVYNDVTARG